MFKYGLVAGLSLNNGRVTLSPVVFLRYRGLA